MGGLRWRDMSAVPVFLAREKGREAAIKEMASALGK